MILLHGNDIESKYATKIMLQYSFIEELLSFMSNDEILKATLMRINMYNFPNKKLLKYADGLLWRLTNYNFLMTNSRLSFSSSVFSETIDPFMYKFRSFNKLVDKRLFISHEVYDTFICRKIKKELGSFGVHVILNTEVFTEEYSFKAISNEIKKSDIVLIFLSQRYKVGYHFFPIKKILFNHLE